MARVILISVCIILMLSHVLAFKCIRERISPNEGNDGFIHSPNYPREYPSNSCYIWYHMVSTVTKVVIKIQDLDIPSMDNCRSNSSNRLFIGPHNKHQYCGTVQSDIVYEAVISDYFYIVFVISESITPHGRGFLLHYELSTPDDLSTPKRAPTTTMIPPRSVDDIATHEGTNPPCFFSTTDSYGTITIPKVVLPNTHHFQYSDDGSKSCTWLLDAPNYPWLKLDSPLFRYALRFEQFHFFPDCCSLDIYEGSDDHSGRLVGHYFSASHPHSLYALGPQVFMKLYFNNNDYFGNFTIHFQREELCRSGYSACSFNETGCYPVGKRCDGVWDCPLKGGDERGCTSSCSDHKFSCGNTSAYCFSEQDRCNGKGACANYRDEQDCSPLQCSSDKGLFLCKNKRCIYEKWRCDHTSDCEDGSDEEDCDRLSSPRLIIACVVGTMISSLLLVLALSFAIRVYALRMRRRHGDPPVRHESLLSRIEEDLIRRRAPPPQYNEAMMTSRSYDEAYLELLNNSSSNAATENNAPSSSTQEGGNSNNNNNSSTATTNGSSRRERGRRSGNRRRNGRDRRMHRNLRIQRQQQHLHGCAPSPILPPPPLPLHYFTELPPSYSDSTSGAATGELVPTLLSSDNDPSFVNSDLNSGDDRNHELQPMSSVVISSASASSNTTTAESNPPPYSLHNELQSDSSGSDLDDDDDDDDDLDDDDMINIDEQDGYVNSNFSSSSSRRVVGDDDDDDDCLLLTGDGSDNDLDEDENEEDDTCLSVIPESTHAHMLSLCSPPIPPNISISSDLMTATELQQMSTFFKEEEDDSPNTNSDEKEEQVVGGGGGGSSKEGGEEEEEPVPATQTTTPEESCQSQTTNVAQSSMKERKPSQPCNSNGQPMNGGNSAVDDDDDDECILSGEAAVLGSESECNEDTSDTACLLAS